MFISKLSSKLVGKSEKKVKKLSSKKKKSSKKNKKWTNTNTNTNRTKKWTLFKKKPDDIINSYHDSNVLMLIENYENHLKEFSHDPKLVHKLNNKYYSLVFLPEENLLKEDRDKVPSKSMQMYNYFKNIQFDENVKCEEVNQFINDIKTNPNDYEKKGIELNEFKNAIYYGFWASGGNAYHLFHKEYRLPNQVNMKNFSAKLQNNTQCKNDITKVNTKKKELKNLIQTNSKQIIEELDEIDKNRKEEYWNENDINNYQTYNDYSRLLNEYNQLYRENKCSGGWMF